MSIIDVLAEKIRSTLVVLNSPIAQEMAIYSAKKKIYSDLGPLSVSKVAPFMESFMLLGLGDNLSLTLGDGKIIIVSKISDRAVLIVVTNQKIGAVLAKLRDVVDKHRNELDMLLSQPIEPPKGVAAGAKEIRLPPTTAEGRAAYGIPSPPPLPPRPPPPPEPSATIETFMAPVLVDKTVLKNSSGDDKKILSLCTGRFSIEEISRKTKLPANIVIETVYRFSQEKTVELREEKRTGEEEAIDFLKRI